jgi:hypothetical protein
MNLRWPKNAAGTVAALIIFMVALTPVIWNNHAELLEPEKATDFHSKAKTPSATEKISAKVSTESRKEARARKFEDEGIPCKPTRIPADNNNPHLLYLASQEYIAATPFEADKVARRIGFLGGRNESASLACGPLSIAILKDARWLPSTASVQRIWLLCPRDRPGCNGLKTLQEEYFPPEQYDYLRVAESIKTYDFRAHPLQPGDWIYLFASVNGFDHMLVVTRVDSSGIAYSVTNLNRGDGFVIVEAPLYDPSRPGHGLFYELTDPARGDLGMSGNGGFLLVRKKI